MSRRKSPSDRARAWAKKWADYNHPEEKNEAGMWIGFFTGGCKGWYRGYMAAMQDVRRRTAVVKSKDHR